MIFLLLYGAFATLRRPEALDLYYWMTPNGHKITLFLEETQLPYRIIPVDIGKGEQFEPAETAAATATTPASSAAA